MRRLISTDMGAEQCALQHAVNLYLHGGSSWERMKSLMADGANNCARKKSTEYRAFLFMV